MQIQSFINIRQNPKADFYFGFGAINILALVFLFNFLNPGDIDTDGGIFSAVAYKDINGGVLYKDAWENKPPGIFYMMEIFLQLIPDKIYALYTLAVIGVLALINGLYFTVQYLVGSLFLSLFIVLIFLFYGVNSLFLGDGLYTEIFGSVFIIWSLYAFHIFENSKKLKHALFAATLAGFSFWFKEPFIFIAIPVIIFLAIKIRQAGPVIKLFSFAAIPSLLFILVLWVNGSLKFFLEMIRYNFSYVGTKSEMPKSGQFQSLWNNILEPLVILLLIILVYALRCFMNRNSRNVSFFNLSLLGAGLFFVLVSPHNFNHYYLPFLVLFFYCVASFLHYDKLYFKSSRLMIYVLMLYLIKKADDKDSRHYDTFFKPYRPDKITQILREDKSKTLFVDLVDASEYYIKGEKLHPAFLPVPLAIHFNESKTGISNREKIYEELRKNKPDFLILGESSSYMYWHVPDPLLYYGNYVKIDSTYARYGKMIFLWKRK